MSLSLFVHLSSWWSKEMRRREVVYGVWWCVVCCGNRWCMVYAVEVVYVMLVQECWKPAASYDRELTSTSAGAMAIAGGGVSCLFVHVGWWWGGGVVYGGVVYRGVVYGGVVYGF